MNSVNCYPVTVSLTEFKAKFRVSQQKKLHLIDHHIHTVQSDREPIRANRLFLIKNLCS